jgi:hypothetical protein
MSTTSRLGNAGVVVDTVNIIDLIGTLRASHDHERERTSVDIGIRPVTPRSIECGSREVVEQVGNRALDRTFQDTQTNDEAPAIALIREIPAPVLGVPADDVSPASLGLGGRGLGGFGSVQAMGTAPSSPPRASKWSRHSSTSSRGAYDVSTNPAWRT